MIGSHMYNIPPGETKGLFEARGCFMLKGLTGIISRSLRWSLCKWDGLIGSCGSNDIVCPAHPGQTSVQTTAKISQVVELSKQRWLILPAVTPKLRSRCQILSTNRWTIIAFRTMNMMQRTCSPSTRNLAFIFFAKMMNVMVMCKNLWPFLPGSWMKGNSRLVHFSCFPATAVPSTSSAFWAWFKKNHDCICWLKPA